MVNDYVKMETITFPDKTRRYRVFMPTITGPFGISTESFVMANKIAAMRVEELRAIIKGK